MIVEMTKCKYPNDEYRESLENDLVDDYEDMTDKEYDIMIDKIVKETAFISDTCRKQLLSMWDKSFMEGEVSKC